MTRKLSAASKANIVFFSQPLIANPSRTPLKSLSLHFQYPGDFVCFPYQSQFPLTGRAGFKKPGRMFHAARQFCGSVQFLVVPATSAYAQSAAEEAYRAYADGLRKLGIEVSNDPVRYDSGSDTLTVPNFRMTLSGSIEMAFPGPSGKAGSDTQADGEKQPLAYALAISFPTMTMTGLVLTDGGGVHADTWLYPEGAGFAGDLKLDGTSVVDMNLTMSGIRAQNYTAFLPEPPTEDPLHRASRWLPVLSLITAGSYDRIEVDDTHGVVTLRVRNNDGVTVTTNNTIRMTGYRIVNFKDGVVGEFSIDGLTQHVESKAPGLERALKTNLQSGARTIYKDMKHR